jgi:hypothetical protein
MKGPGLLSLFYFIVPASIPFPVERPEKQIM